jgi:quercetin dioxygenase-like cupin family protein
MRAFVSTLETTATHRSREHGGEGPIAFRRLMQSEDFVSNIDFVDTTVIPPQSTIGWHEHVGSEELYYVVRGTPRVRVNNEERRLREGDVAVVRSGQSHELINDTADDVQILVVQVHL